MKCCPKPTNPDAIGDIMLRNGLILRGKRAGNYRFGEWTGNDRHNHPHDYDIVKWQETGQ